MALDLWKNGSVNANPGEDVRNLPPPTSILVRNTGGWFSRPNPQDLADQDRAQRIYNSGELAKLADVVVGHVALVGLNVTVGVSKAIEDQLRSLPMESYSY